MKEKHSQAMQQIADTVWRWPVASPFVILALDGPLICMQQYDEEEELIDVKAN